jgi:geranylgeranyl diphosphate synthase type II
MRYGVFPGGKRIRPVITVESAIACGGRLKEALPAACAIELVHTYSLIHDDLPSMDDDDYRRGRPACHKAFGEATAILAGDALLTLAFNVIAAQMRGSVASRAVLALSGAIGSSGMVGGQALDILPKSGKKGASELVRINLLKTAKLFQASAALGAISAGASSDRVAALAAYGLNLGRAFQIVDDIIDRDGYFKLYGEEGSRSEAGKAIRAAKAYIRQFKKNGRLLQIAGLVLEGMERGRKR